jgi:hypothetical protein
VPSVSASVKDSPAGDMAPFIIFMAFVILTTVIIISIYRINSEEDALPAPDGTGFTLSLNARDAVVFSADFPFPGFRPVSLEAGKTSRPALQQDIVEVRRMLNDGEYERAEDLLRTLFLFYPDDIEILYLLSSVLHASGRDNEAEYYDERMFFLLPSPIPETIPSSADATDERTAS